MTPTGGYMTPNVEGGLWNPWPPLNCCSTNCKTRSHHWVVYLPGMSTSLVDVYCTVDGLTRRVRGPVLYTVAASTGAAAGGIIFIVTYVPFFFIGRSDTFPTLSAATKTGCSVFMNLAMGIGCSTLANFESTGRSHLAFFHTASPRRFWFSTQAHHRLSREILHLTRFADKDYLGACWWPEMTSYNVLRYKDAACWTSSNTGKVVRCLRLL